MNHRSVSTFSESRPPVRSKVPTSRILQAALDLFSSKGYEETKMADIASSVGLSVGTLYLRFRSKEDLCLELIKDQTKDYDEHTQRFSRPDIDPLSALKGYIEFSLEYACSRKQLLSMFIREHRLPFIQPLRKNYLRQQQAVIREILVSGTRQGSFAHMDHDATALMIFACIRGTVLMKIVFGIGDTKTLSNDLFTLITEGITKGRNTV